MDIRWSDVSSLDTWKNAVQYAVAHQDTPAQEKPLLSTISASVAEPLHVAGDALNAMGRATGLVSGQPQYASSLARDTALVQDAVRHGIAKHRESEQSGVNLQSVQPPPSGIDEGCGENSSCDQDGPTNRHHGTIDLVPMALGAGLVATGLSVMKSGKVVMGTCATGLGVAVFLMGMKDL